MAIRHLERNNDLANAKGRFALGVITLKTAAEVGVSRWETRDIFEENGVRLKLGPEDAADAGAEIKNVRDFEWGGTCPTFLITPVPQAPASSACQSLPVGVVYDLRSRIQNVTIEHLFGSTDKSLNIPD